jgi:zinc protease
LVKHHAERFGSNNCTIFVSGKIGEHELNLLNEYLGKINKSVAVQAANNANKSKTNPHKAFFSTADTVQTSIKIGIPCFNRQHPDYYAMFVLNTIIGGYFGSRLMVNIREDKGYTYNIYSTLDTMKYNGYFYISTDTSHDLVEKTKIEIYKELKKLQEEPILEEEHKMVKNYLLGNFLTMIDGPYNTADVIKTFITEGLDIEHFNELIHYIIHFRPVDMQETAKKYLNADQMWEVTVGGK